MNGLWQAQGRAASAARAIRILVLASMLSGCTWFGGGSKQTPNGQSASYPNLGTVPTSTPATPSAAQRERIAQGLVADQQNAAYSADQLTARATAGGVPPPEPPPPIPAPASPGAGTPEATSDATSAQESPAQGEAAQPEAKQPAGAADVASPQANATVQSAGTKPAASSAGTGSTESPSPPANAETPAAQAPAATPSTTEPATSNSEPAAKSSAAASSAAVSSEAANSEPLSGMAQPAPSLGLAPPAPIAPPPSVGAAPAEQSEPVAAPSPQPFAITSLAPPNGSEAIVASGRPVALIFFADGSAALTERDRSVLRDVLLVQKQQGGHLRVVGHASGSADSSDEARQKLDYNISLARAKAVSGAFVKLGAPADAIAVSAVGAKEPMFAESAPTGEAGNRRVEIFLDR
jgi:flagellar motor protein MotB